MYATKDDLITRFGLDELQAFAWDADAEDVDDGRINQALNDASEMVDLYIATVARLPLAEAPPILVTVTCDIARYRLQDDRPLDEARERYDSAIATLKDIATGKATLIREDVENSTGGRVYAQRDEHDRTFTNESLADFL